MHLWVWWKAAFGLEGEGLSVSSSFQFDGEKGDNFQQQAAEFVRSQFTALENLKQQQKRDQRLANFLQEQENNPACRRLQLKDMLPAGFQRLSKVSKTASSARTEIAGTPPAAVEVIFKTLLRSR